MNSLTRLQAWYAEQCDGRWEHRYGVEIRTLDDPGWRVYIDLTDTPLARRRFDEVCDLEHELEWIRCTVKDGRFEGAGGPHMLEEILLRFLQWASEPSAAL